MDVKKAIGVDSFLGEIIEHLLAQSRLVNHSMQLVRQKHYSLPADESQQLALGLIDKAVNEAKAGVASVKAAALVVELLSVALHGEKYHSEKMKKELEELNQGLLAQAVAKLKKYLIAVYKDNGKERANPQEDHNAPDQNFSEAEATQNVRASRRHDGMPLLALRQGQRLSVVGPVSDGWSIAQVGGHFGLVPSQMISLIPTRNAPPVVGSNEAEVAQLLKELQVATLVVALRFEQMVTGLIDSLMAGNALLESLREKVAQIKLADVRKVIADLVAIAGTRSPPDLWKANVKLIIVIFLFIDGAQAQINLNANFYDAYGPSVTKRFQNVSRAMLELNKLSLQVISNGFDDTSNAAVRQGAVNFVLVTKDLIQIIGDDDARVKTRTKSRESKTISAPVGQIRSTFNVPSSPNVPDSIPKTYDLGRTDSGSSMEDILEDYEGSDYSDVEEDPGSGTTASSASQKPPLPTPPSASQPPPESEGPKAQPTPIFHRRSIKRPQPTSLHIGSLDRGTFLGGKNSAPSPGTFEIPEMQPLENSSKRFASTLRALLASLKANEKEKYYPETEMLTDAVRDFMQEASRFLTSFEVVLEDDIKAMASHKVEYMNSQIQRLILASKIASGVWPPEFALEDLEQMSFAMAKEIRILFGIVSGVNQRKGEYIKLREDLIRKQEEAIKDFQEDAILFERQEKESPKPPPSPKEPTPIRPSSPVSEKPKELIPVSTLQKFAKKIRRASEPKTPDPKQAPEKKEMVKVHESIQGFVDQILKDPTDLVLEEQEPPNPPVIKAGSLRKLVERLTFLYPDPDFMASFLMTYDRFTTGRELTAHLIERFDFEYPNASTEQYFHLKQQVVFPIHLRIFNVLRAWLEKNFDEDVPEEDKPQILSMIEVFVQTKLQLEQPGLSAELKRAIAKKKNPERGEAKVKGYPAAYDPPNPIMPSSSFVKPVVTEVDPTELGRQLALFDHKIFLKIGTKEWLSKSWNLNDKESKAPNIQNMIHAFNEVTRWVITEILQESSTPRTRAQTIKHFINVAERCRAEKNYNSLQGIVSGLQSASIHRLLKSWAEVPKPTVSLFRELETLVSPESNFENLRCKLLEVNPPCVPWIGLYLRDLTFVEDGNPNIQKGTKLINFDKFRKLAATVKYIQVYQAEHYNYTEVPLVVSLFANNKALLSDENEQFALSLRLEPKEPPPTER